MFVQVLFCFVCLNKWKQMLISFFRPAVKHVLGLGDPKLIPRGTAVVKCSHMSMENMNLQHPVVASVLNLFPVQFASCTFLLSILLLIKLLNF